MSNNHDLVLQAIESAEKSLAVARQLLGGGGVTQPGSESGKSGAGKDKSELLGEIGVFDGESLVTDDNHKFQVPPNYASKSLLVPGDVMRMVTGTDGVRRFKQIQKVPRIKVEGILTKKDGQWAVVSEQGVFRILPASVKYFDGEIGDEAHIVLPKEHKKQKARWAALEKVVKGATPEKPKTPEPKKPPKSAGGRGREASTEEREKEKEKEKKEKVEPKKTELKGEIKVGEGELR